MSGAALDSGSPGSHSHADRPNWQPATRADEYLRNCHAGLEEYSDRRMAKLLGMSRIELYRAKLAAELPNELFELLLKAGVRSTKALAQIALSLKRDEPFAHEEERCPHCGGLLRRRRHVKREAVTAIVKYLNEGKAAQPREPNECPSTIC
jgi:hypothetical protein